MFSQHIFLRQYLCMLLYFKVSVYGMHPSPTSRPKGFCLRAASTPRVWVLLCAGQAKLEELDVSGCRQLQTLSVNSQVLKVCEVSIGMQCVGLDTLNLLVIPFDCHHNALQV
jgi:hypothetical protein